VRFARLIHRRVRAFGPAFGGNLNLTWLPRRVVPHGTEHELGRRKLGPRKR
jgi:hypothetical protein